VEEVAGRGVCDNTYNPPYHSTLWSYKHHLTQLNLTIFDINELR